MHLVDQGIGEPIRIADETQDRRPREIGVTQVRGVAFVIRLQRNDTHQVTKMSHRVRVML